MKLKLFILVTALIGALLLCACSSGSDSPEETLPDSAADTSESTDAPESETAPITEEETVAQTEPPEEILVPDRALESFEYSPMIYTPSPDKSLSLPYAKPIKSLDELTQFCESITTAFDLNAVYSETYGAFIKSSDSFLNEIKKYNSAYFKEYALIIAAVEVPGAMGYLPEIENVEYADGKITVTVTSDPLDNIKTNVFHILISIPLDKYSENVEIIFNRREEAQKGVPVSLPFTAKPGGHIKHDIEHVGFFPQYSGTTRVFENKEDLDKYLSSRHFSGYVKNAAVGTTFMESVAAYDEKFFEEKTLIIFGTSTPLGTVPQITSLTMDNELFRIGFSAPCLDYWHKNTYDYYCFIEVDKTLNVGKSSTGEYLDMEHGIDSLFVAEIEPVPEIDLSIPNYNYQIAPITDNENFTTYADAYPYAVSSRAQLAELSEIGISFNGDVTTDSYPKSFKEIAGEYTDEFFNDKMLVLIKLRANKGETIVINEVRLTNDNVTITLSTPKVTSTSNEDSSPYYVFLELPTDCYSERFTYTCVQ